MLSNLYQVIYLFRYDLKHKTVFILAKNQNDNDEELQIIIFANGIWRFIDDETRLWKYDKKTDQGILIIS